MRRRLGILLAFALAVLLGGVLGAGLVGTRDDALAVTAPSIEVRGPGDAGAIVPIHRFRAGQATVPGLEVFPGPDLPLGTVPASVSPNPTHEGFPLVVAILEQSPSGDWFHVRLPQRPNGSTGWVRAADLTVWDVPNRIEVSIGERTLRVFDGDGDTVLFETLVAVGADRTPTPQGDFYIDIVNPLYGDRIYGWGQLSVAGFSDVLQRFAGGIGQIAIHGWNNPSAMGRNVSNGCVRMNNGDIARVAELAPLGTPVMIHA